MALKGPEHTKTRLPLIDNLVKLGWKETQIQYDPEWRVPKSPSEASKREVHKSFNGFPVDVAIFDSPENYGDWEHLSIIIETKEPNRNDGISQLEIYMSLEPRVLVGYWTNGNDTAALFRTPEGKFKTVLNAKLPKPSDNLILPSVIPITWNDLESLDGRKLKRKFERLLDHVVANDTKSTRRDDQLNQLCNLLLVKLESDKKAKVKPNDPVDFQVWKDEDQTFKRISDAFSNMKLTNSDMFSSLVDQKINLDKWTVQMICFELANVKLLDTSIDVLATAFQTFRTASLKSEEGQYFTPFQVIKSAVKLMEIDYDDVIIDPACGSGGFLLECFNQMKLKYPHLNDSEAKAWAQKHLYGVDKDEINIKLTKAMMMILGDGSTHTYLGDSLREHLWPEKWPYLVSCLKENSYTCIITNPPFGKNLKLTKLDAKNSKLSICNKATAAPDGKFIFSASQYEERELGLIFMERCYKLLIKGGRLGIILPETYFFSKSYAWLQTWLEGKFILKGMFNVPMEAFQGYCRAKTNFYVFEKE